MSISFRKSRSLISRVRRRIQLEYRRRREVRHAVFPASRVSDFRFYQFRKSTAEFFHRTVGRTDIRTMDTPHYALAMGNPAQYAAYIQAGWGTNSQETIAKQVKAKIHHLERFKTSNPSSIVLTRLGDDFFVVDGNHRAAFSIALGRDVPAEIWPIDLAFSTFSDVKRFYGSGNRNMPYQSIFYQGKCVIPGRRDDALERLSLIPSSVIQDMSILDVASNYGMSSLLARSLGASCCTGLEISSQLVDLACRFAMFEGLWPHVQFRTFDVDKNRLTGSFDTAFMFSVYSHLKQPESLARIVRENIRKYVVLEGHPNDVRDKYQEFFAEFKTVSEIGRLPESVFQPERTRILWLCEK